MPWALVSRQQAGRFSFPCLCVWQSCLQVKVHIPEAIDTSSTHTMPWASVSRQQAGRFSSPCLYVCDSYIYRWNCTDLGQLILLPPTPGLPGNRLGDSALPACVCVTVMFVGESACTWGNWHFCHPHHALGFSVQATGREIQLSCLCVVSCSACEGEVK